MEPAILFKLANLIAMLGWVVMIILHDKPITYRLIFNGIVLLLSLLYASAIAWSFSEPQGQGDFSSLEGVMALFANPKSVLAGWIHYLAFDMMMGLLLIYLSVRHEINRYALLPALFFTFMFGPVGLLIFYGLLMYKQQTVFPTIFTSAK